MSSMTAAVGSARGVLFCHAVSRALAPHVEWAIRDVLNADPRIQWRSQPVQSGALRCEVPWLGRAGTAARLTSALRIIPEIRFEVTEDATPGREGERYMVTPGLGLHRATVGVHGDILVSEDRLRAAVAGAAATGADLAEGIAHLLGEPWDVELEAYRVATCDTPVRVLHHVG